ncbi:MAG: glycosyltransferase family 2 protein [Desulfonatronovibrionaceae bacterium]
MSVILPCYNSGRYIRDCLESLRRQTFTDFEVLAVDDGSIDNTAGILEEAAGKDGRFFFFRREKRGVVSAANYAIRKSRGEYIARMDSDDICSPFRLERQVDFLDCNPKTGAVGSLAEFGGDPEKGAGFAHYVQWANSIVSAEDIDRDRFVELPVPNPTLMFRACVFAEHGMFRQGDFPEDYEFFLRLLDRGVRVEKIAQRLLVWNDPQDRLSRVDPRYHPRAFFRIKSLYLERWLRLNAPGYPKVGILGAGKSVEKKLSPLLDLGIRPVYHFDVSRKRLSGSGSRIRPAVDLPPPGELFMLSYVGSRRARNKLLEFMRGRGYRRGRDYLLVS